MAFTVKENVLDDEGNSYTSVEFANDYFADRPKPKWTDASDAERKGALIAATDYVQGRWASVFTDEVNASVTVPVKLQQATCQYALRALDGPLVPDPTVDANGLTVVMTRKKVGPLEREYEVIGNAGKPAVYRSYPEADILMVGLIKSSQSDRVYR